MELCRFLGIPPMALESSLPRLVRHVFNAVRTGRLIRRNRPKILLVQNPSILLTLLSVFLRPIYGYKLVVDAHNAALVPETPLFKKAAFLLAFLQRRADLTIVTNEPLAKTVANNGGRPFVLPDKIPTPNGKGKYSVKGRINIACICTFKPDEPYRELFEAAKDFPEDVCFYVTGDFRRCPSGLVNAAPRNMIFTGFLGDPEYWTLLSSVDLVVDLTSRENCLVCGAYEAVAVKCPMVLSDTAALRKYFSKGAIYTPNKAENISEAIRKGIAMNGSLKQEVASLNDELAAEYGALADRLKDYIAANSL